VKTCFKCSSSKPLTDAEALALLRLFCSTPSGAPVVAWAESVVAKLEALQRTDDL